jgi:hypothetical protein
MVDSYKIISDSNAIKNCEINIILICFQLRVDHLLMLLHDNLKEAFMQGATNSPHELTTLTLNPRGRLYGYSRSY